MYIYDVTRHKKTIVDGRYFDEKVLPMVLSFVNNNIGVPEIMFCISRTIFVESGRLVVKDGD